MLRLSRLGLGVLLLNLVLVGQELACAHEAQALEVPASTDHHGPPSHHEDTPAESDDQQCDDSGAQCCDAIASCAVGVPGSPLVRVGQSDPAPALSSGADSHLVGIPLEVATPPPRR